MPRLPTPIANEVERLATAISAQARTGLPYSGLELQRVADQLRQLARRTAPVERFHAELIAEAAAEELRQSEPGSKIVAIP